MEREQLTATVRAAQQGDEKALSLLFNTYYNDVYYFALKTLKDEDLACDITQETFVEIINTLGELKVPEAFVTWMRQVTYHQCTRYFKKKKEVLVEEDEDGNSVFDTLEEEREEFIPGEGVDKEDFRATILALLDTLSEEQRAAVLMHYYHEMSVKDIAEVQQVSEGTVKSRLNYARKSLKKSVEDYEKKHDVKLHCAGVLPLLLWLFASAGKEVMPVAAAKTVAGGVATATSVPLALSAGGGVATVTATTAAGTGLIAKIGALPVVTKVVAGIVAVALVVGGVGVAIGVGSKKGDSHTQKPSEDETAATTAPSEAVTQPTTMECPHEWTAANCVAPKTCTLCGATEGALADHAWQFVSCEEPQFCSGCDQILPAEGHKWVDANYQSAKHCTECDITEGEPLQPDFEKYGLNVVTPQIGVAYDYLTTCCDDSTKKTVGKLYFTEFQTFDSDELHKAAAGYIWNAFTVEIHFEDENALAYGMAPSFAMENYYDVVGWSESVTIIDKGTMAHTVNFNGEAYSECRMVFAKDQSLWQDDTLIYCCEFYWRVPIGYDGFVFGFVDSGLEWGEGQYIYDIADDNTLLFRFGSDVQKGDTEIGEPLEPSKTVEYILGNGYKRVKDFDPATNTGRTAIYYGGIGAGCIYEDEYIFYVTPKTLTYEIWCSWDQYTRFNFQSFSDWTDATIDDSYNYTRITRCENYTCGWENHYCYSEDSHQSMLEAMEQGCYYCGETDCISFYARNEGGFTEKNDYLCPEYDVRKDPIEYCQDCGKPIHGKPTETCSTYIADTNCHTCGEWVTAWVCHTCATDEDIYDEYEDKFTN